MRVIYLYDNHLGGIYHTLEEQDYYDLDCETCGDSDSYLGKFDTPTELKELIKSEGYNEGYIDDYIKRFMKE